MCVKLVIYKNYTEMHGQQNINIYEYLIEYKRVGIIIFASYWRGARFESRNIDYLT